MNKKRASVRVIDDDTATTLVTMQQAVWRANTTAAEPTAPVTRHRRRVLIWQSLNLRALPFMYGPVTSFLRAAFLGSKSIHSVVVGAGTKRNE